MVEVTAIIVNLLFQLAVPSVFASCIVKVCCLVNAHRILCLLEELILL